MPRASASLFEVRSRDFGVFAVVFGFAPTRRSTGLSAARSFCSALFLLRAFSSMLRVLPSRNSEDPKPQLQIVTFMDLC